MPTSAPVPDGWPVQAIIIGHVTDAHVGGSYIYKIRLTEALQNIGRRADLIVDSGDCTENGYSSQWTDYLTAIRSAQAPMRVVPGNHDSTWPAAIGAMRWYLDIKGYRIIGINGREGLDRAWLEPLLAAGLPTILVRHQPLVEDEALAWLCRRYNVLAFLSGQLHQNVLKQVGAVTVVVGARVATGNYRLVAIREDQVTVEWH
jgi:predicted phosphodiesterase